jgi:predicted permease
MGTFLNDIKHSLRRLAKSPGFTAAVILTLALCFGANIAIFAVVDAILLRPLPFPKPDRLVCVFNSYPAAGDERSHTSIANYFDRRQSIKAFASVSIYQDTSTIVGGTESPDRVPIARISPDFFQTLGVPLARGKAFTDAELTYQTDRVAILTDGFWRSRFNADPGVLGRTFLNDGLLVTVVGVLPRDFRFLSSRARFFRPASHAPEERGPAKRHDNNWNMIARLAPDATLADAQTQIDALNVQQTNEVPYAKELKAAGYHSVVRRLHDDHVRAVKPIFSLLQAGVFVLLLIGGVNLVNLLLIRAHCRAREFAVRQALGAGRLAVAREVLAETLLLACGGAMAGLLFGVLGIRLLWALGADQLPLGTSIVFDGRVALLALMAAIIVGTLLAMPIIWFNLRKQSALALQSETRGGTVSAAAQRLRHCFIVAQVALAFVLLAGAGLLGVSLKHALETPTGFNPDNVLTGRIVLPGKDYPTATGRLAFVERLLSAIRTLPGVTCAAINTDLPFTEVDNDSIVAVEGHMRQAGESIQAHYHAGVTSDYWRVMSIPLLRGRVLEDGDNQGKASVCVVDQAFADRYWPGVDPLGRRLCNAASFDGSSALTVVGVVANVKRSELTENTGHGMLYLPYVTSYPREFSLVVRSALPAGPMAPMLRKAVLQLDPELPLDDVKSMQVRIDDSLVVRRSPALLATLFSGFALLLSVLGTYGVLAYAVSGRQREIGVRLALGAQPGQIRRQFLWIGMRLVLTGSMLGVVGAWMVSGAMRSVLFEVSTPLHGVIFGGIALALGGCSLAACLIPALRAGRIDPQEALRCE